MKFLKLWIILLVYYFTMTKNLASKIVDGFSHDHSDAKLNLTSFVEKNLIEETDYRRLINVVEKIIETTQPKLISIISVIYPSTASEKHTFSMINELLTKLPLSLKYRLQDFDNLDQSKNKFRPRYYNVIFLNNYEEFVRDLLPHFEKRSFDFSGFYVIILTNHAKWSNDSIKKMMTDFWNFRIVNLIVLIHDINDEDNAVMGLTYFPFSVDYCEEVHPVVTIKYVNGHFSNTQFFPWKLRNFHGCPLIVGITESPPFITFVNDTYVRGIEGYILRMIGTILNFKHKIIVSDRHERQGKIYSNGTVTGGLGLLSRKKVNISIGFMDIRDDRAQLFDHTSAIYTARMQFLAAVKARMSPIEWMGVAFRKQVWIGIIFTLLTGFFVIFLVKKHSKQTRNFVIGRGVSSPYLNLVTIFLGNPLIRLPGRNFARTLVIFFIFFTLVLRTAYQGALFDVAQHDRAYITSFQQMIEQNFTFYSSPLFQPYIDAVPKLNNNVIYLIPNEEKYMKKINGTQISGTKESVLSTEYHIFYMNRRDKRIQLLRPARPDLAVLNIAMFLPKQSILTRVFSIYISLLSANGLVQKSINHYFDRNYMSAVSDVLDEMKPFTLDDVWGIFQLLISGLVIATFVLLIEIIYYKLFN